MRVMSAEAHTLSIQKSRALRFNLAIVVVFGYYQSNKYFLIFSKISEIACLIFVRISCVISQENVNATRDVNNSVSNRSLHILSCLL